MTCATKMKYETNPSTRLKTRLESIYSLSVRAYWKFIGFISIHEYIYFTSV